MTTEVLDRSQEAQVTRMEPTRNRACFRPNVDIIEDGESLTIYADMPGVRAQDVDIEFENGQLTITGRVMPRQEENATYLMREYGIGDFIRTFRVSEQIDSEHITATCVNGVLTVRLPKVEAARARKIEVRAG